MERIIIFGDSSLPMSEILLKETLRFTSSRDGVQVVAVCDSGLHKPTHLQFNIFIQIAVAGLTRLFDPESKVFPKKPIFSNLYRVAQQFGVEIINPPDRNINHPKFVQYLREEFRPSVGLSFGCLQIFGKELFGIFDRVVNYHNGLLPAYRGLCATRWSIYHGELQSGFTFHFMNEKIDAGHILIQDAVSLAPSANPFEVEFRKTIKAAGYIENMFEMLKKYDLGRPQRGTFRYFGWKEFEEITTIYHPSELTSAELQRRLLCFQVLHFPIDGKMREVTKIKEINKAWPGRDALCFVTNDQKLMRLHRFLHMPFPLYRIYRFIRGVFAV